MYKPISKRKIKSFIKSLKEKLKEKEEEIERYQKENENALKTVLQLLEQKDNKVLEDLSKKYFIESEKLQKENAELRKGQHSLMQSRKKWKDKYYELKRDFKYIQHEHDRLDKRNNELLGENEECIKKSLIQDKIKKYENEITKCHFASDCMIIEEYEIKIEALKELLKK